MNFANVKGIAIPQGVVKSLAIAGEAIWSKIISTTKGKVWTKCSVDDYYFGDVAYADGLWVACTSGSSKKGLYYSEDGKSWTKSNGCS